MHNMAKTKSSAGRWAGWSVIWGREHEHATPYMTRVWIGRLRVHAFHRGDQDPDCHDHPWDFWTFPLQPYVEEVVERVTPFPAPVVETENGPRFAPIEYRRVRQVVPAWRWTFRPAEHCHRVLGLWDGIEPGPMFTYDTVSGTILTIVWRGRPRRKWGFLRERFDRWCWTPWKKYVYDGGKDAPCEGGEEHD